MVRILTWNLDHGFRGKPLFGAQAELVEAARADVAVLTELPVEWSGAGAGAGAEGRVVSPARRPSERGRESWVGIVGPALQRTSIEIPFERMAAAALANVDGDDFVIYGSVLPWNAAIVQAPYLAQPGGSAAGLFERVLAEQVADLHLLRNQHPGAVVLWAGDFNQPLEGSSSGFSKRNRCLLEDALEAVDLITYNRGLAHAKDGYCAIDLICGPASRGAVEVRRIDPVIDGRLLSDHAAYVIDL